jgi:hypothetical protein
LRRYDADSGATLVHINGHGAHTKLDHPLPLGYEDKPSKKAKTATSGFFNRMFGTTGAYTGRQPAY